MFPVRWDIQGEGFKRQVWSRAERSEFLTQVDTKGMGTDEIPLGPTAEGPRTTMFRQ